MSDEAGPTGKGRPTPKRSQAQRRRRTAIPKDRKEAARLRREQAREQRQLQRRALATGDERHLPPRDAGPERRAVRDRVDARFVLGQWFYGLIFVVVVPGLLLHLPPSAAATYNAAGLVALLAFTAHSVHVARRIAREVKEQYGAKTPAGLTMYALLRCMQPRRLRRPPATNRLTSWSIDTSAAAASWSARSPTATG